MAQALTMRTFAVAVSVFACAGDARSHEESDTSAKVEHGLSKSLATLLMSMQGPGVAFHAGLAGNGHSRLARSRVNMEFSAAPNMNVPGNMNPIEAPPGWQRVPEEQELWSDPKKKADTRIEGGKTLKTYKMPPHAERVQYILQSPNGRPMKAKVNLWIGPVRDVHELIYNCMFGGDFPLKATLQFKKLEPVLKISGDGEYEFPVECGVFVPTPEESKRLGELTQNMFYSSPLKAAVQGGSTIDNKGGAIRSFTIPNSWEKTQIMVWSKDVGKKSFKTNIEIIKGPNNQLQHLNLRCGGSTQPYHAVIETPGSDWVIRCNSKKFIEDGKFEIAVAPYGELGDDGPPPVQMSRF